MFYEAGTYRDFLKAALTGTSKGGVSGRSQGTAVSLTSCAKRIGTSVSFLSEVLSAKKSLSVELAFKIAVRLGLTDLETQYFCLLVQLEHEKDATFRGELIKRLKALNPERIGHDLSLDLFRAIADWYHFALLELTQLPDFKLSSGYVSKRLGISRMEAETAIERLKRLELLEKGPDGKWKKSHGYVIAQSETPNAALKVFHKQLLEKVIEGIDSQEPRERLSASSVLAFDSQYLPEVDRLSDEFSSAVFDLCKNSRVKDTVYCLSIHFTKLNQEER